MGRPVHYFTGEGVTGCCGKKVAELGLGAILTPQAEAVTCPKMPQEETFDEPGQPSLEAEEFTEGDLTGAYMALGEGLRLREGDQQLPVPNGEPDIQSQVIADIVERREVGIKRYGTALQPFNGRDATRDLYEELLDGAMYAKQILVERQALIARIAELEARVARLHRAYLRAQGIPDEDMPS